MIIKVTLLIVTLFSSYCWADYNQVLANGIELHIKGNSTQFDPVMGLSARPDSVDVISKYKNGKLIHEWTVTIDKTGFRTSSASHRINKNKHLLLIDGSFIFGDNLNDNSTISHQINLRSNLYEAYPVAYSGYGQNQTWVTFSQNKLSAAIPQRKGSAILFTHRGDVRRFLGTPEHLIYNYNHPRVVEQSTGNFVHTGTFENSGNLIQRLLSKFCVPFIACQNLMQFDSPTPTTAEYQLFFRAIKSIETMYRNQFDVENFAVVWVGTDSPSREIIEDSKLQVLELKDVSRSEEGHPDLLGVSQVVDFLFSSQLVK